MIITGYIESGKIISIPGGFGVFHRLCGKLVEKSVGNLCAVCYHIEINLNFFRAWKLMQWVYRRMVI